MEWIAAGLSKLETQAIAKAPASAGHEKERALAQHTLEYRRNEYARQVALALERLGADKDLLEARERYERAQIVLTPAGKEFNNVRKQIARQRAFVSGLRGRTESIAGWPSLY